ncbi:MAG TPA: twitching motility protein PilT [Serratia grimesii]|uniref:Twitching motility protein PilT n=1 Tax=Serratia grimesii TaxID=82995 RepID=A0A9C7QSY8_9GAMM|nr:twitching motility protein PilT [Serratia grimesii]
MAKKGRVKRALDQLIAAHAQSRGATRVTHDRAFAVVPGLAIEDWTWYRL